MLLPGSRCPETFTDTGPLFSFLLGWVPKAQLAKVTIWLGWTAVVSGYSCSAQHSLQKWSLSPVPEAARECGTDKIKQSVSMGKAFPRKAFAEKAFTVL